MSTTWIIAADSSRAKIFEMHGNDVHHLQEIMDFDNPAGHENDQDLVTDAKGRYYGKGEHVLANTAEPRTDPVTYENEMASKAIGDFLEKARTEQRYDKLCLIAPPKFMGMLRQNMTKEAQRLVEEEMVKDISWLDQNEIEAYLSSKRH